MIAAAKVCELSFQVDSWLTSGPPQRTTKPLINVACLPMYKDSGNVDRQDPARIVPNNIGH
jgi:hypothetical protein